MVSIATFGPGDTSSISGWFAVSNSSQDKTRLDMTSFSAGAPILSKLIKKYYTGSI